MTCLSREKSLPVSPELSMMREKERDLKIKHKLNIYVLEN